MENMEQENIISEEEKNAIISYDELISKTGNVSIVYSDTVVNEDNDVLTFNFMNCKTLFCIME